MQLEFTIPESNAHLTAEALYYFLMTFVLHLEVKSYYGVKLTWWLG